MGIENQRRPGGWLPPRPKDEPTGSAGPPRVPYPLAPELPQDAPDPWDLLPPAEPAVDDPGPEQSEPSRPRRRRGRRGTSSRLVLVGAVVAVVLIGSGALAQNLTTGPTGFPAPTAPPEPSPGPSATTGPSEVEGRLGAAPTAAGPTPTPTATASPTPSPTTTPEVVTTPTGSTPVGYEAEQADLRSTAEAYQVEAASAGYAVRGLGGWLSGEVRFTVEADRAGEYELTLYYLADRSRSGQIRVNGGAPFRVEFPGLSGADEVGTVSLTVTLREGGNEIRFGNPFRGAPALDRITLAAR